MDVSEVTAPKAKSPMLDFDQRAEFFQIRGQIYTLITLRVMEPEDHQFFINLHKEIGRSPDFYRHAPVVIDIGPVVDRAPINLAEFGRRLRQLQLVPVGVQNGNDAWNKMAINAGFGIFPNGRPAPSLASEALRENRAAPLSPKAAEQTHHQEEADATHAVEDKKLVSPPKTALRPGAKVITDPVRAGQQIYAENADLIALGPVRPGAELLADGNIHVYSSLHGRAHAGVGGDMNARIFCHDMQAQLISIAGIYMVNEQIEERFLGQRVQIRCRSETIVMERLD